MFTMKSYNEPKPYSLQFQVSTTLRKKAVEIIVGKGGAGKLSMHVTCMVHESRKWQVEASESLCLSTGRSIRIVLISHFIFQLTEYPCNNTYDIFFS